MSIVRQVVLLVIISGFAGCGSDASDLPSRTTITLATTTSTRDSGLLDELVRLFEKRTGIEVKVVAVGSGQALELGRRGDADVLLTHVPDAEKTFVAEGYGIERREVMYNDFVIVGPASDPAGVRGEKSVTTVMSKIAHSESPFVSRGDNSGTYQKEKHLWQQAGVSTFGTWYVEAGGGMALILRVANERRAYTLTDRSTFLAQRKHLDLEILSEGDPLLHNIYSVILVNPEKNPNVRVEAARRFADFFVVESTQQVIANFGVERHGQPLFFVTPSKRASN